MTTELSGYYGLRLNSLPAFSSRLIQSVVRLWVRYTLTICLKLFILKALTCVLSLPFPFTYQTLTCICWYR